MNSAHWTEQRERASDLGISFLIGVMKLTSPRLVKLLVVPVALYYFFSSPSTRKVSADYLSRLRMTGKIKKIPVNFRGKSLYWLTFRHILSFAWSMVDRVYAWSEGAGAIRYKIEGKELMNNALYKERRGALFLASHLGNFDLAIVLSEINPEKLFNVVLHTGHTRIYNRFRKKIFNSRQVHFIEPEEITPFQAISLVEKAANGEMVIIAADRTINTNSKNSVLVNFLGDQAAFPSGPYIMAYLLGVPVYFMFAVQKHDGCLIKIETFEQKVIVPRKQRQIAVKYYAQKFAARLERECLEFPFQWYNFYDFWAMPDSLSQGDDDESS